MKSEVVWSKTTRILHWAIALPVALNFFIDGGDTSHKVLGYGALGFLLARLVWGFRSSDAANFRAFPLFFGEVRNFLSSLRKRSPDTYPGHNPLASWTYVLIWTLVFLLGVSGFMMGLDAFWGEEWLEELHEQFSAVLSGLVLFHLAGLVFDGVRHRRKTWLGMLTGRR